MIVILNVNRKFLIMNALKLISLVLFDYLFSATSPVVDVKNGSLVGTVMKSRHGRSFFAYRGIPYALSPIGDLRFEVSHN